MADRFVQWTRRKAAASPPWLVKGLAVGLVALPLLAWAGAAVLDTIEGADLAPLPEVDAAELYVDSDRDGLSDLLENYVYGSDPGTSRTASQVVPDGYLARYGFDPTDPGAEERTTAYPGPGEAPPAWGPQGLAPAARLTVRELYLHERPEDWDENVSGPWDNGLSPLTWESPSGLPVPWLVRHGLDPRDAQVGDEVLAPPPEGDGLSVRESYETATDPHARDTDGDGLADHDELRRTGTDPARFSTGGGVADGWAIAFGLDPTSPETANADPDRDGLTTAREFQWSVDTFGLERVFAGEGLDPTRRSSGGAPLPDGWLVDEGLDPFEPGISERALGCASEFGPAPPAAELEDVCLTVRAAYLHGRPRTWDESVAGPWRGGLSARTNDTDGDGLPDAVELRGWMTETLTAPSLDAETRPTHVVSDPLAQDTDLDGLSDLEELLGRTVGRATDVSFPPTDPGNSDTDFDGLRDGLEVLTISALLAERTGEALSLDPTSRDTDRDGLQDGHEWMLLRTRAADCREGGGGYGFTNPERDVRVVLGDLARASGATVPSGSDGICELLEPWGDPDADGIPNVLDKDSDQDSLLDGWESLPALYDQSPFASEHPRSRTDLINPDSDGDGLPDDWEVKFGRWDNALQAWNLDPAKWSSFDDEVSDAERDLDDDGITWYSFHRAASGYDRRAHTFVATNLVEYLTGTDPNAASTADNGLLDGWVIFWGRVYTSLPLGQVGDLYPGAPGPLVLPPGTERPAPLGDANPVLASERVVRFSSSSTPRRDEVLIQVFSDVRTTSGEVVTLYRLEREVELTFLTAQEHATNPYLRDTDGDGASDAYELGHRDPSRGMPDPTIHERETDADGDGLALHMEAARGTSPNEADTDGGGARDGEEVDAHRNPLSPLDDASAVDPTADIDCDGVPDGEEVTGWSHPRLGTIRTSPGTPDGDLDGLLDGFDRVLDPAEAGAPACIALLQEAGVLSLPEGTNGRRFLGEGSWSADPAAWSSADDGVPDGFRALWEMDARETRPGLKAAYTFGRPDWWSEPAHGPWLWGQAPVAGTDVDGDGRTDSALTGAGLRFLDRDLDNDGLDDMNGEDPTPGARSEPVPPQGDPRDAHGREARRLAALFGVPPEDRDTLGAADRDRDGVPDRADRTPVRVLDLTLVGADEGPAGPELQAGKTYNLTGRVETTRVDGVGTPSPVPVQHATVIVQFADHRHPVGAGATDARGAFEIPFTIAPAHAAELPPGVVLFGQRGGLVTWTTNVSDIALGPGPAGRPNSVRAFVANTSGAALPGEPTYLGASATVRLPSGSTASATVNGIQGTASETLEVLLTAKGVLTLTAPDAVSPGSVFPVAVALGDEAGRAIPGAEVVVSTGTIQRTLVTGPDGRAEAQLPAPAEAPATALVTAAFAGEGFVRGTTAEHTVSVRRETRLTIQGILPNPAVAGRPLEVRGTVAGASGSPPGASVTWETGFARLVLPLDPEGRFEGRTLVPPDRVGETTLTFTFEGTETLLGASASMTLPILGETRLHLTLPPGPVRPGQTVELQGRLTDLLGTPIPGARLRLVGLPGSPGPLAPTDGEGLVTLAWAVPDRIGSHLVTLAYDGSPRWTPARAEGFVAISTPTRIHLDPAGELVRGSVATTTGRLSDDLGAGLPGQPVSLSFDGAEVGATVTGDDGRFSLAWVVDPESPLGPTRLLARFNGSADQRYQPSERADEPVVRQGLRLDPLQARLVRGDNRLLLALTLDDGRPAPPGTLALAIPALDHRSHTEVTGTRAVLDVHVPTSAPLGPVRAQYLYSPGPPLPSIPIETVLQVASPPQLNLAHPPSVLAGAMLSVTGRVLDDQGAPVPSGLVELSLLAERVRVPVSAGRFAAQVPVAEGLASGPQTLGVLYLGSGGVLRGGENTTLAIQRPVRVTLTLPASADPGDLVRGEVTLTDDTGQALGGRRLLLRSGENTTYLVTTDRNGRAPLLLRQSGGPSTTYDVRFAGDERFGPATAAVTTEALAQGPGPRTLWLVAAGLGTLTVLAALVAFWRYQRRTALESAIDALDEGRRQLLAGNEYRASVLHAYRTLVSLVAAHDVGEEETETLREYQARIGRVLGLPPNDLGELFDIFDGVFYGSATPGRATRDRAVRAMHRVADRLRRIGRPHGREAGR